MATAFTLARIISNIPLARGGPASVVIFDIHALQVGALCWGGGTLGVYVSGVGMGCGESVVKAAWSFFTSTPCRWVGAWCDAVIGGEHHLVVIFVVCGVVWWGWVSAWAAGLVWPAVLAGRQHRVPGFGGQGAWAHRALGPQGRWLHKKTTVHVRLCVRCRSASTLGTGWLAWKFPPV